MFRLQGAVEGALRPHDTEHRNPAVFIPPSFPPVQIGTRICYYDAGKQTGST